MAEPQHAYENVNVRVNNDTAENRRSPRLEIVKGRDRRNRLTPED